MERERHDNECEQLRTDKKDMVAYLNKTLKEREAKLSDLSTQLSDLQTQYEEEQRKHCAQVSQLQNQLQQTTERLTTDNENLRTCTTLRFILLSFSFNFPFYLGFFIPTTGWQDDLGVVWPGFESPLNYSLSFTSKVIH